MKILNDALREAQQKQITENEDAENELNELIHHVFTDPAGEKVLNWMKSISINHVLGPDATNEKLRHHEGMRFMVAVLEGRFRAHEARMRAVKKDN